MMFEHALTDQDLNISLALKIYIASNRGWQHMQKANTRKLSLIFRRQPKNNNQSSNENSLNFSST